MKLMKSMKKLCTPYLKGSQPLMRSSFFASFDQYTKDMIDRELMRAYAGFSNLPEKVDVATGNWGCGVFGG